MFSIPTAIFTEAFLSFVGVGIVLPQCSIGSLIEAGFNNITTLPYQILPPIAVLALLMLGSTLSATASGRLWPPSWKICEEGRTVSNKTILEIKDLDISFRTNMGAIHAIRGVNLDLQKGETVAIVGESGSGKTTIGRSIIRLYDPTAGSITFEGKEISGKLDKGTRSMLRRDMQMIFQDPMSSLNLRKKVVYIIGEGLDIHRRYSSAAQRAEAVGAMLKKVGLSPAHAERYPHQFSGGRGSG